MASGSSCTRLELANDVLAPPGLFVAPDNELRKGITTTRCHCIASETKTESKLIKRAVLCFAIGIISSLEVVVTTKTTTSLKALHNVN